MQLAAQGKKWKEVADDIGTNPQILYNYSSCLRPWPDDLMMAVAARLNLLKKFKETGLL
jgi:hypothetical protein